MWFKRLATVVVVALPLYILPAGATQVRPAARAYQGTLAPDLIGRTQRQADSLVQASGLTVGQVTKGDCKTAKPGTVTGQVPAPRTSVARGSRMDFTVCPLRTPSQIIGAQANTLVVAPQQRDTLIAVPKLIGLSPEEAAESLARDTLTGKAGLLQDPSHVGRVVRQEPAEGSRVAKRTLVRYWYGAVGPTRPDPTSVALPSFPMPDLQDRTLSEAVRRVETLGLMMATVQDSVHRAVTGRVIEQSPLRNQLVQRGTAVSVRLGAGRVIVPPIVNQPLQTAGQILRRTGLIAEPVTRVPSGAQPETVIWQEPSPGITVDSGSSVALRVAAAVPPVPPAVPPIRPDTQPKVVSPVVDPDKPADTQQVTALPPVPPKVVPNVVRLPLAQAMAVLQGASLSVGLVDTTEQDGIDGRVVAQRPPAGTNVLPGAPESVTVGISPRVTVPGVIGRDLADATVVLESVRLTRGAVRRVEDPGQPGRVIAQDPDSGSRVVRGSAVSLTVTSTIPIVRVPPLAGLTRAEAGESLIRSGLVLGTVAWSTARSEQGRVIAQVPESGSVARHGDRVHLTMAAPTALPPPTETPPVTVPEPQPVPEAPPPNAPLPWGLIAAALVTLGGLASLVWRSIRGGSGPRPPEPTPPPQPLPVPPVLWFEPHLGSGKHVLSSDTERVAGHEVQLAPHAGIATHRIEGDETFTRELP